MVGQRDLVRSRLDDQLRGLPAGSLCVLVAPAGSGKTTALRHAVRGHEDAPVWLTIDRRCADEASLLARLREAFGAAPIRLAAEWPAIEDAVADLSNSLIRPLVLVIDDGHEASGSAVTQGLRVLLECQPANLTILLSSRAPMALPLARRRLAGPVVELDMAALRFRLWEIDELFHHCYQTRITWEEARLLADRTDGWAAGLHMAHLATTNVTAATRLAMLQSLSGGTRLIREYLSALVLDAVSDDDRDFLLRTSVLDEMTGGRCDDLLGVTGSGSRLAALERRGLFVQRRSDGRAYHYHDVLRAHLLETLADQYGQAAARDLHRRAARILRADDANDDALKAFVRAGEWKEAARLLGRTGDQLAARPGDWLAVLPDSVRDNDAWCGVAVARATAAQGALPQSAGAYRRVLARFPDSPGGWQATDEIRRLEMWLGTPTTTGTHWVNRARLALAQPERVIATGGGPAVADRLVTAAAHLAAGAVREARGRFESVLELPRLATVAEFGAAAGVAICAALQDDPAARAVASRCVDLAGELGWPVAGRLATAIAELTGIRADAPPSHLTRECDADGDDWGRGLIGMIQTLAAARVGSVDPVELTETARRLDTLGAPALGTWARLLAACGARCGERGDNSRATLRAGPVRRRSSGLVQAIQLLSQGNSHHRLALELAAAEGATAFVAALIAGPRSDSADGTSRSSDIKVDCLGGLRITVGAEPVATAGLSPRNLELLRYLCVHAGAVLPTERVIEAIWPSGDPARARHSLHTAVSTLRRHLDLPGFVVTDGDSYQLAVTAPASDIGRLRALLAQIPRGPDGAAVEGPCWRALDAYPHEVLPEAAVCDWLVDVREELRGALATAAARLVASLRGRGEAEQAVLAATRGLEIAPYHDALWRGLIEAHTAAGNHLAARAARLSYRKLLGDVTTAAG